MFRSTQAFVGLGGNVGDRHACLRAALEHLDAVPGVSVERVSPWYETAPVGGPPGQSPYLNGVAEIRTDLEPLALLRVLLCAEAAAGRRREGGQAVRWGPRTADLDLLLYGEDGAHLWDVPELTLPHPRMHERAFVLRPMCDLAPDLVHPRLGITVRDLLQALQEAAC